MAAVGNNTNPKYSHVRDSFFCEGEIEHFEKIMKDPKHQEKHEKMKDKSADVLYAKAMDLIRRVEHGEFKEEEMEEVELKISHYLMGIEDVRLEYLQENILDCSI